MIENKLAPWHLWGKQVDLDVGINSPGVAYAATGQLVKIAYGRPETWRFLLAATLIEATDVDDGHFPPKHVEIFVRYKVIVGIGRSSVEIPDWQNLQWQYAPTPPLNETLFTSLAGDRTADILNVLSTPRPCDLIVAQDLQMSVEVDLVSNSVLPCRARISVHAYFSPSSHFRPDWLQGDTAGVGGS